MPSLAIVLLQTFLSREKEQGLVGSQEVLSFPFLKISLEKLRVTFFPLGLPRDHNVLTEDSGKQPQNPWVHSLVQACMHSFISPSFSHIFHEG